MAVFIPSLRIASTAVLLILGGCVSMGPDIPAYRASADRAGDAVAFWDGAQSGSRSVDQIPGIVDRRQDPRLEALVDRARRLRIHAENERIERSRTLLARIQQSSGGPSAGDLSLLAELRRTGLPEPLDVEVRAAIDQGIASWSEAASKALAADKGLEAVAALTTVSMAAADGRHPRLELEAMDRATRLSDRIGMARMDSLPARAIPFTLERLVSVHVDRPHWRTLVEAGFESTRHIARGHADRNAVEEILDEFNRGVRLQSSPDSDVPSSVKRGLLQVGRRLESASKPPESMFGPHGDGVRAFVDGMVSATDIRTRAYYGDDARALDRVLNDTYIGIGTELRSVPEGVLLSPFAGSPARRAGLRRGDILLEVDGVPVKETGMREIVDQVLGRSGTVVEFTVRRRTSEGDVRVMVVPVIRGEVTRETINGWRQIGHDRLGRPLWDWIIDPECSIAYIAIREFVEDTDRLFRTAITEADRELKAVGGPGRQIEGLILDLRENGGGRRDSTERLLDLFLSDGLLFETQGSRQGRRARSRASSRNTRLEGIPLVVIVDEGSASASEMLAGTLQARAGAIVVGERTFGKGSVQQVGSAPDGYLVVTESWFLVPEEGREPRAIDRFRDREGWGITPDVPSPATSEETSLFLEERGGWRSGLGQDPFDLVALPTIETTTDRPLLDAVIILRRRLNASSSDGDPSQ